MIRYLPAARKENIVVQEVDGEVLVYDLSSNKAYCLNGTSAAVYLACDGFTKAEEVRRKHKFSDALIDLALEQLDENGLLEKGGQFTPSPSGMSRRNAIRKVAVASAVALPLIMSVTAPTALYAVSVCGLGCAGPGVCGGACPNCTGPGICSAGATPCTIIGAACTGIGFCIAQTCSVPGGICVGAPDGTPCSAPGICTGAGTCGV